jgi:hypothetical protein
MLKTDNGDVNQNKSGFTDQLAPIEIEPPLRQQGDQVVLFR